MDEEDIKAYHKENVQTQDMLMLSCVCLKHMKMVSEAGTQYSSVLVGGTTPWSYTDIDSLILSVDQLNMRKQQDEISSNLVRVVLFIVCLFFNPLL